MDPRSEYSTRLNARRASLAVRQRQHRQLGNVRLVTFLGLLAMAFLAFARGAFSGWWLLLPLAVLIGIGFQLQRLEGLAGAIARAVAVYERALARLDGQWAGKGQSGDRFADDGHLYARDLDLFGTASLFELLCQARTAMGEEAVAAWLLAAARPDTVSPRQLAVRELDPRIDFREDLAVLGDSTRLDVHPGTLTAWGEMPPVIERSPFRVIAWVCSLIGAVGLVSGVTYLIALLTASDLPAERMAELQLAFVIAAAIGYGVEWRFRSRTARITQDVVTAARDLGVMTTLLKRIESEAFTSRALVALRAELLNDGTAASEAIAGLRTLVALLGFRRNEFMRLAGPLLLWNVHLAYAVEDWRRASGPAVRRWLHAFGQIEALVSFAWYAYENPRNVFPELQTAESPLFEAEGLRHPLISEERAVANDVSLGSEVSVLIVSGSNMSGKSTLLRTIGINAVLAQAGAPVCARRLRLSPLTVGASIRLQDSLWEGTSRFYAEISRLRQIVEASEAHPPVLFLIDEFLHGTNSHDRFIGAEAIVRGLVERGAVGLITTHDLALARIADTMGPRGVNVHFQDYLDDGRMRFDYRLRPGIVQHSNALALMRAVGLEV